MSTAPRFLRVLLVLASLALLPPGASGQEAPPRPRRVVVLGIDGADAEVFTRLRAEGKLPHFDALAKRGAFTPLATTNPAQSPVAWAAFATGSNPGKSGIYDFLRRDPDRPGKIEVSLASPTSVPFGPEDWLRNLLPFLLGAAGGLLVSGVALFLLRLLGMEERNRRRAALAAGFAAAALLGVLSHRVVGWIPATVPKAISNRRGTSLWVALGEAGVPTLAVEAPVSFPADRAANLRLLSGLGTPDVQATWGLWTFFTDDPRENARAETGGTVEFLAFDGEGTARTRVYGPRNFTLGDGEREEIRKQARFAKGVFDLKVGVPSAKRFEQMVAHHAGKADQASCLLEIRRDPAGKRATVRVGAGGPRPVLDLPLPAAAGGPPAPLPAPGDGSVRWSAPVVLEEGKWSGFLDFEFVLNPLVKVKGIAKMILESAGGERPFRLLLEPVNFDPREVPEAVELSFPAGFAPSLASKAGLYHTLGWPCLTNPVKDMLLSDEAFLGNVREVLAERKRKLRAALADPDWRFLFMMFSEVDRVQHALWRHVDGRSPLHDAATAAKYGPAIEEFYVAMDGEVGAIVEACGPDTAVLVMSDHGFAPFRRGVNLNTWLLREKFQRNKGGVAGTGDEKDVTQLFAETDFFARIDWEESQAYAVGLGAIYVNLEGREKQGSVAPADYDAVCAAIRERLLALRDGDGSRVVREVYLGKDLYRGPTAAKFAPDLVVGFERGYRVSWQTTLGGGGSEVIEDNRFPWSGDHCSVDPSLVPGILATSFPLGAGEPSVMDVGPTVLDLLGVPRPAEWDGKSLVGK